MKMKLVYLGIAASLLVSACKKDNNPTPVVVVTTDSLTPGTSHANDIYYSFTNGVVGTVSRTNWIWLFLHR